MSKMRLIGPWGNVNEGPQHVRPEGAPALDHFGRILEAAAGDWSSCTVELCAADVHALGRALRRVAAGEDARHVFGQNKVGHRQGERQRKQTIAWIYWTTLARLLDDGGTSATAAKREAIARAQQHYPRRKIDADTVTKYAREWRDNLMPVLEHMHRTGQGPSLDALRRHLEKHGQHMSDGPDLPPLSTSKAAPKVGRKPRQ